MKTILRNIVLLMLLFSVFLNINRVLGQCPTLYDNTGTASSNPYWVSCSGGSYTLFVQSPDNIGTWTVDWGDGSASSSGPNLIPPAFISHLYGATINTMVVTFTETSTGCVIIGVVVMEKPVNASIQIPIGGVTATCAPESLDFINASTDVSGTTTFWWDFGDGSPILVFDSTNTGQTISHLYLPGTVNCVTQVTLTAENYCSMGIQTVATFTPIQIWDIDNAGICASSTLMCYPDTTVHFDNCTNMNCFAQGNVTQRFEYWNFGDYWGLGYDSIIPWQPYNPPARPGYDIAYPGIGLYNVMIIDSSFCGIDTGYITVNIVPQPTSNLSASTDTVCPGETITFINSSNGGANSFDWNFGDGSGWQTTGSGNQNYSYSIPGDYTITLVANITGGTSTCTDTATIAIHVLVGPIAGMMLDNNVGCDALTVNYTDVSANAVAWSWDFDNGNTNNTQNPPSQNYTPGNYIPWLTVTSTNGCVDTTYSNVDVFISPTVDFFPTNACQFEVAQFFDNSFSSIGDPIISWFWDMNDGNTYTVQNPTNIFTTVGTYWVVLSVFTANCSNTDSLMVTIAPTPTAGFTNDLDSGCTALNVLFTDASSGATSYYWDMGDGTTSTSQNPNHVFVNSGNSDTTFNVMSVVYNVSGCSDTAYTTILIHPAVTSSFTHNGFPDCAPMSVDFTSTSTGATSYLWDMGDSTGSILANPTHLFVNTTLFIQLFTVQLIVTSPNGCTDTSSQNILVYPTPDFSFTANPDSGCSPLSVTFPSIVGAVSYQWDFGDGTTATGPSPTHVFVNSTTNDSTYYVQLIATSAFACSDTTYATVIVKPNPTASFTPDVTSGCPTLPVTFTNTSTSAISYHWEYGNGTSSDTLVAVHTILYNNTLAGSVFYDVTLIAYTLDGCTDTAFSTITVYPPVNASFISDTVGCSPLSITFLNQTTGATSYNWDMGDGFNDVVQDPIHVFTNTGNNDTTYTVTLVATSSFGCTDTAIQNILVHPIPVSSFTALPVNQQYPTATVTLTNNSTLGLWNYSWTYGDGGSSTFLNPGSYTYGTWGTFAITLIVTSPYCADTSQQTIVILPPDPVAAFIGSGDGCEPLTVQFTDLSVWAVSWDWNFGDGNIANIASPTHIYYGAGTYTPSLTVTGPGGSTSVSVHVDSVVVRPRAIAFFTLSPSTVYVPGQPVQFYNLSSYADTYLWDMGDGTTSTDFQPDHYYQTEGGYDVMLIANNQWDCPDTFMLNNAVYGKTGGEINFPNAFTPNPGGGNGGAYDPYDFSNDIFFPVYQGVDEYHLMIFDRWGELIFESFDVTIGWDGYYRGDLCQQNVYVWKVVATLSNGETITKAGNLNLIR